METTRARRGGGWKRCPIPTTGKVGISICMPHISTVHITFDKHFALQTKLILKDHFPLWLRTFLQEVCGERNLWTQVVKKNGNKPFEEKKWKIPPFEKNIPQSPEECTKLRHSANQNINSRTRIVNGVQVL